MTDNKLSWEDAVGHIRALPDYQQLVKEAYLDENPLDAVDRYVESEEWKEIKEVLAALGHSTGNVLDMGAGNGIASFAFAKSGYSVTALEPDEGLTIGRGAIKKVMEAKNLKVGLIDTFGENIPLKENSMDIVFARQVLHHAQLLPLMCKQVYRVLKPGGIFIAIREHVITAHKDLDIFLNNHPIHHLYGGEHAYTLNEYLDALKSANFKVIRKMGPFESVMNYAPLSSQELKGKFVKKLATILPRKICEMIVGNDFIYYYLKKYASSMDQNPGRVFSFICQKSNQ